VSGAATETAKIRVAGVFKTFETKKGSVHVLEGVDLDVRGEEFLAIVGPSGCGKSTLLNCIAGFEGVTRGSIEIDGERVTKPSRKRVFVFQETGIFPWLTVQENVGFGLGGLPAGEREDVVARYVALVGLEGFEKAYPAELSGGMKQRVEFARALAVESDVLFLDEPFGALDAFTREELWCAMRDLQAAQKFNVILVTHDLRESVFLADTVYVMSKSPGRFVQRREIDLPRPRDLEITYTPQFTDIVHELRGHIGAMRKPVAQIGGGLAQ
jgi:NitT/TauT family transport system ATP-binding protein